MSGGPLQKLASRLGTVGEVLLCLWDRARLEREAQTEL
jgi:hypothetical protein